MKSSISYILIIFTVSWSCKSDDLYSPKYYTIGTYSSRGIAEKNALDYIFSNNNKFQTQTNAVLYTYKSHRNAIHYDSQKQLLHLEIDPGSGYIATWDSVSVQLIKQIIDKNGDLRNLQTIRKNISGYLAEDSFPY